MDLRIPVAAMFFLLGGILVVYGLAVPQDVAPVDLGIRVNLVWGLLLCLFGAALGLLARLSRTRN